MNALDFNFASPFHYIQSVRESGMLLLPGDGDSREAQLGYVTFNRIQRSQYALGRPKEFHSLHIGPFKFRCQEI